MMLRKVCSMLLCLALMLGLSVSVNAASAQTVTVDPINVMVGGKEFLPTDANGENVPVFAYNGTTYAPLRALAEAYGLVVGFNAEQMLATVDGTPTGVFTETKGTERVLTARTTLSVVPMNIEVNGAVFEPKDATGKPVSVFAYNGTTYAPLRALAEAYGLTVGYDSEKNLATVSFDASKVIHADFAPYLQALELESRPSQNTVTAKEFAAMLDRLVEYAAPDRLAEWQTMYPVLRESDIVLKRIDMISAIFLAGQFIGGGYDDMPVRLDYNRSEISAVSSGEDIPTWELFGDVDNFIIGGQFEDHYAVAATFYNSNCVCHVDGSYIVRYDAENHSFHLQENATYNDCVLALVRTVVIAEKQHAPVAINEPLTVADCFAPYMEAMALESRPSQKTVTAAEFAAMLDKLVAYAAPEKFGEWKTKYPILRESTIALKRIDMLSAVFLAGQFIGGEYAEMPTVLDYERSELTAVKDGEAMPTGYLFGDDRSWSTFKEDMFYVIVGEFEVDFAEASTFYNTNRICILDASYILPYDEENNSFHLQADAAYNTCVLALVRAAAIAEVPTVVAYDAREVVNPSVVLSDALIAKANENPTVTAENHPRWTGFLLGQAAHNQWDTSAYDIRKTAEWGFNSVRVKLHYQLLFDNEVQTADLMQLMELDRMVAAAIENQVHLNICFWAVPGRNAYVGADFTRYGDFDLYINPEKQELALRIFRVIAERYKDIPSDFLSITPLWEPLNYNSSTGLPYPTYTAQDVANVTALAIDEIRAADPDRLIIYDPIGLPHRDEESMIRDADVTKLEADARGNVIIEYNSVQQAFAYANMTSVEGKGIDDMNSSMFVPEYPNYIWWAASHIENEYTLTLNGFLPAGTELRMYLRESNGGTLRITQDGACIYSEVLPEGAQNYHPGEPLAGYYPYAESEKCVSVTLDQAADKIVISCDGGCFDYCGIYLAMPEEYSVERWYYVTSYDVHLGKEDEAGMQLRTKSGVMICPTSDYTGRILTVYEDLTYTSEELQDEASERAIKAWAKEMNSYEDNCIVRFEGGPFSGATWESVSAYYEDLLETYDEYGFSWWSNDFSMITHKTAALANAEYVSYDGYEEFNLALLQLLQKHQD